MKAAFLIAAMLIVPAAAAQKKVDRPKVHADFYFGSIPPAPEAAAALSKDKARLVMVGYHEGWSESKMAKELGLTTREIDGIHTELMDLGLLGRYRGDFVPAVLVVRDRDIEELQSALDRDVRDFAVVVQAGMRDIETLLSSFSGGKDVPMDERLYAAMVGGVLFSGMVEVFADDKTFLPAPPAHGKSEFYGWLVEGDRDWAGKIQRDSWDSESYQLVSVGDSLLEQKPSLDDVRRSGFVLEEVEARRFRSYAVVLARDKLLPFFKSQRDDLLKAHRKVDSGRYSAFKTFFAWYYTMLVNRTVDRLVMSKILTPPSTPYVYALKMPVR
ncbi:MAG TPA: hypothetical protein VFY29_09935 [Terriglobia bacterium]|nr:hypothetical protein [Terriglobia bacterium]